MSRKTAELLTVLAVASPMPMAAQPAAPAVAVAPARTFELRLDGDPSEWAETPMLTIGRQSHLLTDPADYRGDADLSGTVRFAWDSSALYVAGRFRDDSLVTGAAWPSDRVNLLLDASGDNHPLSYGGRAPDASRWQPDDHWLYGHVVGDGTGPYPVFRMGRDYHGPVDGAELASRRTDDGWSFEARVPWSGLPEATPFVGAAPGLQLFVSDGDGTGSLTEIMWSARWGHSQETGLAWEIWRLGRLVLTDRPLTGDRR